jgi:uncharacterized protein involved in outer membrane biogenesis
MLRWTRRALLAMAAIVSIGVLLATVVAFLVVPQPRFQQWLAGRIAEAVGPGVGFGSASLAFWPGPGIRLHEITLEEASATAADSSATIESLNCTLRLGALVGGEVVVDRITIEEPRLAVTRDADGRWIFGRTLQQILARATSGGRAAPAADSPPGPPAPHVFLRDGAIDLDDRRVAGGPVQLRIRNLDADLEFPRSRSSGQLRISLDGPARDHLEIDATIAVMAPGDSLADAFFEADVRGRSLASDRALLYLLFGLPIRNPGGVFDIRGSVSGRIADALEGSARIDVPLGIVDGWGIRLEAPVRLAADFDVKSGKFSMHRARLTAPGISLAGYAGETTAATFDWAGRELRVGQLAFDAYGGAWRTHGSVSFDGTPTYTVAVRADRVAFRELAAAVAGEDVDEAFETLSGEADLHGAWTGPDAWQGALKGSGKLRLAGGQIESSAMIRSLFEAAIGQIPGVSLGGGKRAEEPTRLERLEASFALRDGRAFTEDLVFVTSDYRMEGKGSVGLDGSLDLTTRVSLTARGSYKIYALALAPLRKGGSDSLPAVPVSVSGTLAGPRIVPDLTGLSLASFRAMLGGAQGAVGLLKDAVTPDGKLVRKGFGKVFGRGEEGGNEIREDRPRGADE